MIKFTFPIDTGTMQCGAESRGYGHAGPSTRMYFGR